MADADFSVTPLVSRRRLWYNCERMVYTAVIHREGKLFVATCPEIGSVSQGQTMEEALQNLQEATELYLEEFPSTAASARSFITTFQAAHA